MNSEGLLQLIVTADTADAMAAMDGLQGSTDELTAGLVTSTSELATTSDASTTADAKLATLQASTDDAAAGFTRLGASAQGYSAELGLIEDQAKAATGQVAVLGDTLATTETTTASAGAAAGETAASTGNLSDELGSATISAETAESGFVGIRKVLVESLLPLAAMFGIYEGGKAILSDATTEANLYNSAIAQINNTTKQGQNYTGLTTAQLETLAAATSKNTAVTDAAQLSAQQVLMTYQALGSTIYPAVAAELPNVATAMANVKGQTVASSAQMQQSAKLLGKAFEDPATGMTALTRAGVKFSAAQVAQVKSIEDTTNATVAQALSIQGVTQAGAEALSQWSSLTTAQQTAAEKTNGLTTAQISAAQALGKSNGVAAAQKQMLSDLSDVVAGKASASLDTFQGKVALLQKTFGEKLQPAMQSAEKELEKLGSVLLTGVLWLDKHRKGLEEIIKDLAPFAAAILVVVAAMQVWAGITAVVDAATGALDALMAVDPITIAAVALAAAAILIIKNWGAIKKTLEPVIKVIDTVWHQYLQPIAQFVGGELEQAFDEARKSVDSALGPSLQRLGKSFSEIGKALKPVMPYLKDLAIAIGLILITPLVGALGLLAIAIMGISIALKFVAPYIGDFIKAQIDIISVLAKVVAWWITTFIGATKIVADTFNAIIDTIKKTWDNPSEMLYDIGKDIIQGLINGIEYMASRAVDAVSKVGKDLTRAAKDVLGVFSPSVVFTDIGQNVGQGLVNGINGMQSAASTAASDLSTSVVQGAGKPQIGVGQSNIAATNSSSVPVANAQPSINITIEAGTVVGEGGAQQLAILIWQQLQQIARANGFNGALPPIGVTPQG